MNITPLIFFILFVVMLMTFVVAPLIGTILLWLTSKLWGFTDRTFKSSLKAVYIILGIMLATGLVFQTLFIKDSFGQLAQSSPQTFLWFLFVSSLVGIITGVIAIKKLFQESFAKSIGATITFFVFTGILFVIIVTTIVVIKDSVTPASQPNTAQNNNGFTTQETSPQQTIAAQKTTLISRDKGIFVVTKYPSNSASWVLRLDCPTGPTGITGGMVAMKGTSTVGGVVNCNQDIALDKDPYSNSTSIIFMMLLINQGKNDNVVNIVSKTFDSAGILLNQSTLPIQVVNKPL
jgi:hypothetical protein